MSRRTMIAEHVGWCPLSLGSFGATRTTLRYGGGKAAVTRGRGAPGIRRPPCCAELTAVLLREDYSAAAVTGAHSQKFQK